jgi:asparagine synthase (glutamine-hydrolysing)
VCGICGVIQLNGEPRHPVEDATLIAMTDAMTHRGPDDRGVLIERGVALGVRRLSIVDVEGGHQPIANEDGSVWAVQNGELFNHRDIRAQLARSGHSLRTSCDTEIIPHLYEAYGDDFPQRLRGMFGIAVWDAQRRRAIIARDRLGIKPLYYAVAGDLLIFGSELKSVLASGLVSTELDHDAIHAYLTFGFFAGPRTALERVSKLMPGHVLVIEDGRVETRSYWEYPLPQPDPDLADAATAAEALEELLDESVRLRLMSDVPLGAMLSGGLDSSLIVGLMSRHMAEPVKTFSVGFVGGSMKNELEDARLVANTFGTDHYELELPAAGDVDLAELVWSLDEPLADLSSVGFSALSQLARRHVTVALSGQGADELLGGYSRHRLAALIGIHERLPRPVRRGVGLAARFDRRVRRVDELAALDPAERFVAMKAHRGNGSGGSGARNIAHSRLRAHIPNALEATLYLDAQLGLVDDMLHYFDRMSMAHSLEVRVPFLDHRLVELCARIPAKLKVRRLTSKYVLKRVARGIVPDRIIDKPKIGFFNDAVPEWTRRTLAAGPVRDYLLAPDARTRAFIEPGEVTGLLENPASGQVRRESDFLLALLMLEVWLREFVPRATKPVSARDSVAGGI